MDPPAALSARESAVIEANAVARGIALDVLMENAGRAVAEEAHRRATPPGRVDLLVGPGNNGGDGAVAAHYLRQLGTPVEVWEVSAGTHRSAQAQRALDRARREGPVRSGPPTPDQLAGAALVVDALLGVGHRAPMRADIRAAVQAATASGVPILSVDVPTGLGDPDGLRARWTVALTAPKADVPEDRAGETVVRDIGIPS